MIVAGGIYLENCISPASTTLFGSGGRAALALTGLSRSVQLHAFQPARLADEVYPNFEPFGVDVHLYPSSDRLIFQYLHPLARPRIAPIPLPSAGVVHIRGAAVLRFGCLEGSFQVTGGSVVYDPQSAIAPTPFGENGSTADRLAVVLNRAELAAAVGTRDLAAGALAIQERDGADVVIVKAGPDGAHIFERGAGVRAVTAFAARAINKIGSGDTFSAAYAFYWALAGEVPAEAARLASLHTAEFVETRRTVLAHPPPLREPATVRPNPKALICMGRQGASADWLKEEAFASLHDLGVRTRLHEGSTLEALQASHDGEVLFLIDPSVEHHRHVIAARARRQKVVVYSETMDPSCHSTDEAIFIEIEGDFATALYRVAWA